MSDIVPGVVLGGVTGGVVTGGAAVNGDSNAPMSHALPAGRATPRWSLAEHPAPASTAGLPDCSARVSVGPPLSARAASSGSTPA